jgi:phosphonate transport system substrate-binding protein
MPASLRLVSCLAPCLEPLYRSVAQHLGAEFLALPWPESEQRFLAGEVELAFLCGLGYVRNPQLALLGAPVFCAPRYGDQPIYFSEVLVRADSPWTDLEQLRGARWAYNEPNSQSGYNVMLSRVGARFFSQERMSGSHDDSLRLLQSGEVDVVCIDTTVLDQVQPAGVRSLETLGPSPVQPLLASPRVGGTQAEELRARLLEFPGFGPVRRFESVGPEHYAALIR